MVSDAVRGYGGEGGGLCTKQPHTMHCRQLGALLVVTVL